MAMKEKSTTPMPTSTAINACAPAGLQLAGSLISAVSGRRLSSRLRHVARRVSTAPRRNVSALRACLVYSHTLPCLKLCSQKRKTSVWLLTVATTFACRFFGRGELLHAVVVSRRLAV